MKQSRTDHLAQIIWDYHHVHMPLAACDIIFTLCSIDPRVAEYAADLYLAGMGKYLVFSGGIAHTNDMLKVSWNGTEADHFADIAIQKGVPKEQIIIENKAQNTGQNITFTYQILKDRGLLPNSMLLVQKPYMERRTYATFKKQWPGSDTEIIITSPPIAYDDYCDQTSPKERVINLMVGDLQRIKEYPALGYQIPQDIPAEVWAAYQDLVALGYNKHLIQQ